MRSWSKTSAGAAAGSVTRTARASSPAMGRPVAVALIPLLYLGRRLIRAYLGAPAAAELRAAASANGSAA